MRPQLWSPYEHELIACWFLLIYIMFLRFNYVNMQSWCKFQANGRTIINMNSRLFTIIMLTSKFHWLNDQLSSQRDRFIGLCTVREDHITHTMSYVMYIESIQFTYHMIVNICYMTLNMNEKAPSLLAFCLFIRNWLNCCLALCRWLDLILCKWRCSHE